MARQAIALERLSRDGDEVQKELTPNFPYSTRIN
jgi:hypothetical protein